jgi:predicted dehydrogenase
MVGFGQLVRDYYLPALRKLAGVRVVAVVDPLPESRLTATKRLPDAEIYVGHQMMLDRTRLDGVLVVSPPSTHLEIWTETTGRGIPTFVEKPLALSSQILSLETQREEPRVMIDFNRRFWPTYNRVRDLVRHGALGMPVRFEFTLHLDVLRWSGVTRHRLDPNEGGVLHDLGCHAIDLALQVIGEEPATIAAVSTSQRWTGDRLQLRIAFPGGSSATCDLAYGDRTRECLVVRGPQGTLRLEEPNMELHVEKGGARQNPMVARVIDAVSFGYRGLRRSQSIGRASVHQALSAFVQSVRTGAPFAPGFRDGVRNALWVDAAARSAVSDGNPERATRDLRALLESQGEL